MPLAGLKRKTSEISRRGRSPHKKRSFILRRRTSSISPATTRYSTSRTGVEPSPERQPLPTPRGRSPQKKRSFILRRRSTTISTRSSRQGNGVSRPRSDLQPTRQPTVGSPARSGPQLYRQPTTSSSSKSTKSASPLAKLRKKGAKLLVKLHLFKGMCCRYRATTIKVC